MLGLSVFRRKPRQFEYKPRHFDYEKQLREQRRREVLGDKAFDNEQSEYKPGRYIKNGGIHRKFGEEQTRSNGRMSRIIIRLVIVLVLLGAVAFWLFSSAF